MPRTTYKSTAFSIGPVFASIPTQDQGIVRDISASSTAKHGKTVGGLFLVGVLSMTNFLVHNQSKSHLPLWFYAIAFTTFLSIIIFL